MHLILDFSKTDYAFFYFCGQYASSHIKCLLGYNQRQVAYNSSHMAWCEVL